MFQIATSLILVLFATFGAAQSAAPAAVEPHPEIRALLTRVLGDSAEILRYGHLSTPESLEAIGALPAAGIPNSPDGIAVSRLALLRQEGNQWTNALSVSNGIRNNDGAITAPSERSALYRVTFFKHHFDDGRQRWIIQFTPINQGGERTGRPIHVSWNEILGRYQQISLEGYGFQPEFHGESAD
ncbi:MAG TPA: hypothetical protein VFU86_06480 [Terriglobales bacterium]|nr:hypothetical protein [Terriglobales bacterium]